MRRTLYILILTIGIVTAGNLGIAFLWPPQPVVSNHKYLNRYRSWMETSKADIVLIGNSMLGEGVNDKVLSRRMGKRCIMFAKGGTASAAWYLELKNVVVPAVKTPEIVVIFFRDTFLTRPEYRTRSHYRKLIQDLSTDSEPLLRQLAYRQDPFERFLKKISPAYLRKKRVTRGLDKSVKESFVATALDLKKGEVDKAIDRVFHDDKLIADVATKQQAAAETLNEEGDFEETVDASFLPHMIELAASSNIRLAFVRVKRRRDATGGSESEELKRYITHLKAYFSERHLPFIDFTHEEKIKKEHFGKGDHLNRNEGRKLFTSLLGEALKPLIN